jgi:hypothetical protein
MSHVTYRRIPHAAHTGHGGGWDLEQWVVAAPTAAAARQIAGDELPSDAEYRCGWFGSDGVQTWIFARRAPLSTSITCTVCGQGGLS